MTPGNLDTTSLERVLIERARWVNEEIDRRLPAAMPDQFGRSLREYLDIGGTRVRPSMAVYEPIRHVVEAGGKRVRPTLCMLACEAAGGDARMVLPTAAAIEMVHTFTLIHDDVMDEDQVRRGRPTVAAIWGNPIAITAGDGLFALAFGAVADNAGMKGVEPQRVLEVIRRFAQTCVDLSRGQTMDILMEEDDEPDVERYLEMIRLKTGVLLEFSLWSGAWLGGGEPSLVDGIGRFGGPLGMAFQIQDDLLDLTGTLEVLGKPPGSDLRSGKRTLMVVHALREAPRAQAKRLRSILDASEHKTGPAEVEEAMRILREAGSLAFARQTADRLVVEAKEALEALPGGRASDALRALHQLADFVIHRES